MVNSVRIFVVVATVVVSGVLLSQTALAQGNSNNNRPGWGHGDKNHHHSGPPGHSVHPGQGDHNKHWRFFHFWDFWKNWSQHNRH